jgi:pyrimidine deaminase RibD-like protein
MEGEMPIITANVSLGDTIEWIYWDGAGDDYSELTILLRAAAPDRKQLTERLAKALQKDGIDWLTVGEERWSLDLDALCRSFPKVRTMEFLRGRIEVTPELRHGDVAEAKISITEQSVRRSALPEDRLTGIRRGYRALEEVLETFERGRTERWGIVRTNLFEIFSDAVEMTRKEVGKERLPAFKHDRFYEGRDSGGESFNVEAIATYLREVLAILRDDLRLVTAAERRYMELAIQESRRCSAEDSRPRPRVGVVVVTRRNVLATAFRGQEKAGEHAEFFALENRLRDVSVAGASVYTTLEPCTTRNHPKIPCAQRLIERKVTRVVVGMLDPDPRITGRGVMMLRDANIDVELFPGDLAAQVEDLNREFRRQVQSTLPSS